MTSFTAAPFDVSKILYVIEILHSQHFNWELTKKELTLSNFDYSAGFCVHIPVESDGEETFSTSTVYGIKILRALQQGCSVRIDYNSAIVVSPVTGVQTQYMLGTFLKPTQTYPTQWGQDYKVNTDKFDFQSFGRIAIDLVPGMGRPVVEMAHGQLYLGSATSPGMFVFKYKNVQNVPDYVTVSDNLYAGAWLANTSPKDEVTMNVTDTHVRVKVGDNFIYNARYDFESHVMENALLTAKLNKIDEIPMTSIWWEVLTHYHDRPVVVSAKDGKATLSTDGESGEVVNLELSTLQGKTFHIEFWPTMLPTALELMGVQKEATMTIPENGTSVIIESEAAEILVPVKLTMGKEKA